MLRNAREARSFGLLTIVLILFFVVMMVASLVTSHWQEGFIAAFFTALAIHLIAKLRFAVEATRQINSDHQSGALELLLVTTLSKEDILEGHQRALRGIARKQVLLLICLNFALESWVLLFPTALHMDSSATVMFTSFFVGGMFLAAADFFALRWLGLLHGLRASTHVKAALGAFSSTMLLPWIGLGILIAVVTGLQPKAHEFAVILSIWVGCGLLYDWLLVRSTSMRLGSDLRRLASEGI
jgi:hypothetical protein